MSGDATGGAGGHAPGVTVSILNYQTADLTIACVESVVAEADRFAAPEVGPVEVVVLDNASGDGSAERIEQWISRHPDAPVRLMRSKTNSGFSGGHNQVIAATRSAYLLLLNSDAEVQPGCLSALVVRAQGDPGAGILAARLAAPDGTPQTSAFRAPTVASEIIRGAATGVVTRMLGRWTVPLGPDADPDAIEWVSFACVLLRRSMIDRIGPMDEGFFLYFEDVAYCLRARRLGWAVGDVQGARALHHIGASTGLTESEARARRRPPYYYAARARYFRQRLGRAGPFLANLGWLAGRGIAEMRRLLGLRGAAAAEGEYTDIWIGAFRPSDPRPGSRDAWPAEDQAALPGGGREARCGDGPS